MRSRLLILPTACWVALLVGPLGCTGDNSPLVGAEGEGEGEGEAAGGEGEGEAGAAGATGAEGEGEGEAGGEGEGEAGEGEAGEGEGEAAEGEGEGEGPECDDVRPCRGTDLCINGACIPCGCVDDAGCGDGRVCEECTCIPRCSTHQDCAGGERCDVDTGRCVVKDWCERNSECPGGQACVDRECVDPVVESSCDGAIPLESGVTVQGSTRRAVDEHAGSCSERPSAEVIYTFEVAEPSGVRALVDGTAGRLNPTIFLRSNCGDDAAAEEIACADEVRFFFTEQLEVAQVPAGSYYLFIESFNGDEEGDFEVTLDIVPGQICVGDGAEPNDTRERPADLFQADDAALHLCPADVDWFSVHLQVADEVLIHATVDGDVEGLSITLESAEGEVIPTEVARSEGQVVLRAPEIVRGGQHLLRIDHADPAVQLTYTLDVDVFTLHGTCDCVNPTTLRPGADNAAAGDTCGCGAVTAGSCRSAIRHAAPEIPFKFRLEEPSSVRVEVDADFDYIVYMRQACIGDGDDNELSCEAADDIEHDALAAGVYFVYVDGRRDECGPFEIRLDVGPPNFPPDNNTCGGAAELLVGQTIEGDTTYASNGFRSERPDNPGECETSPFGHTGRDVVFRFEINEPKRIRAELNTSGWEGVVYIREDCELENSQVACGQAAQEGEAPVAQEDLDPGRYFLVVDGYRSGRGAFSLSLTEVVEDEGPLPEDDPPDGGGDE